MDCHGSPTRAPKSSAKTAEAALSTGIRGHVEEGGSTGVTGCHATAKKMLPRNTRTPSFLARSLATIVAANLPPSRMQVCPCNARGATGACTRQECKPSQNQEAPQTRSFREAVLRTNTLSSAWRHGVKQGLESASYKTSAWAENGISQGSSHQAEQAPSVPHAEVTGPHHREQRSTRRAGCRLWPRGGDELGDHGLHQDGHRRVRAPECADGGAGSAPKAAGGVPGSSATFSMAPAAPPATAAASSREAEAPAASEA